MDRHSSSGFSGREQNSCFHLLQQDAQVLKQQSTSRPSPKSQFFRYLQQILHHLLLEILGGERKCLLPSTVTCDMFRVAAFWGGGGGCHMRNLQGWKYRTWSKFLWQNSWSVCYAYTEKGIMGAMVIVTVCEKVHTLFKTVLLFWKDLSSGVTPGSFCFSHLSVRSRHGTSTEPCLFVFSLKQLLFFPN